MHPATKRYHMIDFVMMRTCQRKHYLDVQVIRGAKCWTDHCLVRARLKVMLPWTAVTSKHPLPFAVHKFAKPELRDSYVQSLEQRLSGWSLPPGSTAEEYWNHLQSCVTSSAEESIGRGVRSYPGWFEENIDVLKPLIEEKNQACSRYLQVGTRSCK